MIQDNPSTIEPTINSLRKTFFTHKSKDVAFRKQQLQNLLRGMNELKNELCDALKKDLGYKDQFFIEFIQLGGSISHIEHDIKHLASYAKSRSVDTNVLCMPGTSSIRPEPYGVVLIIGAWNYPYQTSICPVSSAIAAGNSVILKPSELSPHSSNAMAKLFKNYLDPSVYQVIEGGIEVAKAITRQPFDLIIFTGGTEKGKLVAKAAAENLTPCILELGGKSPCIIDGSVDMAMTCRRVASTKFFNSGQTCIAPDYVLVREDVKAQFITTVKTTIQELYGEKPRDSTALNNMVNEFHTDRVLELIKTSGGNILLGGTGNVQERWIDPTLIESPKLDSKLMQEEIFGPVLPVVSYKDDNEVINFINARNKPLALYYFGSRNDFKNRLTLETSSGGICVNDCIFHALNPELPFGGVGYSGYGALYGKTGFDQCSHLKPILDKSPSDMILARYPPFTDSKKSKMNLLNKFGGIMIGDVKKFGVAAVVGLGLLVAYYSSCCSGDKHDHPVEL